MQIDSTAIGLEFSNPEVINDEEFSDIIGLDFGKKEPKTEPKKEEEEVVNKKEEKEEDSEEGLSLKTETKEEVETDEKVYVTAINELVDLGYEEVWEDFDENAPVTKETLTKFLEVNINKKVEESFDSFFTSLSDYSQRLIKYDVNSKGENVDQFLRTLVEENQIKSLDAENEYDQEKILRQWYKNEDKFTSEEIDEKIGELKDAGLMEKEAKRIKPKLDLEAESIARQKEEEQKNLRELEKKVSEDYTQRVISVLKEGQIKGVKLNKEDLSQVYSFLTNDEMEVTIHGGKKATMTPLEAIIFFNKYDKKGSLENLALATLLLTNPEKFEDAYTKRAVTKVTNEVVKDIKKSNGLKIGGGGSKPDSSRKETPVKEQHYKWPLVL